MSSLYILNTLSNMHVGSGEMNFGIIDNQVQRDVITNYPTINPSSLKGAIKEYFQGEEATDEFISYVFGGDSDSEKEVKSGKFKFFAGKLLVLPVRSNKIPFYRAISPEIVRHLIFTIENFNISVEEEVFNALRELSDAVKDDMDKCVVLVEEKSSIDLKIKLEDFLAEEMEFKNLSIIEKIFGENICIMNDVAFKDTVKELPVIARNCLENGISKNLWYEEVVPRESRFYFTVIEGKEYYECFDKKLTGDILQIGANASIGYGYTKVINISRIGD